MVGSSAVILRSTLLTHGILTIGRPDNGIYRGRLCFSYQPGDGIASALGNQAAAFQCGIDYLNEPLVRKRRYQLRIAFLSVLLS